MFAGGNNAGKTKRKKAFQKGRTVGTEARKCDVKETRVCKLFIYFGLNVKRTW